MIGRRRFLALLGLAPFAPAAAVLAEPLRRGDFVALQADEFPLNTPVLVQPMRGVPGIAPMGGLVMVGIAGEPLRQGDFVTLRAGTIVLAGGRE
jgi:hypothetical protein